jgi:hypothetical protein
MNKSQYIRTVVANQQKHIDLFEEKLKGSEIDSNTKEMLKQSIEICKKVQMIVRQPRPDLNLLTKLMQQARDLQSFVKRLPEN